jgi:hypothetical protein
MKRATGFGVLLAAAAAVGLSPARGQVFAQGANGDNAAAIEAAPGTSFFLYRLKNEKAAEMATTLNALCGAVNAKGEVTTRPATAAGGNASDDRTGVAFFGADVDTNSILVAVVTKFEPEIKTVIGQLDRPIALGPPRGRGTSVGPDGGPVGPGGPKGGPADSVRAVEPPAH